MKLYLGVTDTAEPEGGTTGEVGDILEKKYGIFTVFGENYMPKIVDHLSESVDDAIAKMIAGKRVQDPYAQGTNKITEDLKNYIKLQEVENFGIEGVPTQAALEGRTLRTVGKTKRGKKVKKVSAGDKYFESVGPRRPSFMYSGVFQENLKAWMSDGNS